MKKYLKTGLILLLLLAALITSARAQFLGGFFNQKATQNKYLLQQIAALQVYDTYLGQGYNIVKNGTGVIGTIKDSDLSLHTGYFDSLKTVSTSVRNYSRVKGTIQLQQQIMTSHNQVYPQLTKSGMFTATELTNFNGTYQAILQHSQTDLEELQLVITNGKLSLTDNERIARIDRLYKDMQALYGKGQRLNNQALALAAQRSRESKDNKTLKSLYGQ